MSGAEGDVIVVLAAQFANLPTWFVGLVAAGAMAAAIATTAGLFITASSAVAHDIYTELVNPDATQRQQVLVGRATIVGMGALVTVTAFDPPALVGELVASRSRWPASSCSRCSSSASGGRTPTVRARSRA